MAELVRVNGRIIRKPTTARQQRRFDKKVSNLRAKAQQESNRRRQQLIAKKLDQEFQSINYTGDVESFKKQYNEIPAEIRQFMEVNPTTVNKIQRDNLSLLGKELSNAKRKLSKEKDKVDKKGLKAQISILENAINQLNSTIVSKDNIKSLIDESFKVRKEVTKQSKLRKFNLERATRETQAFINKLNKKSNDPNAVITVEEFEKARNLGISSSEILNNVIVANRKIRTKQNKEVVLASFEDPRILNEIKNKNLVTSILPGVKLSNVSSNLNLTASEKNEFRTSTDPVKTLKQIEYRNAIEKRNIENLLQASIIDGGTKKQQKNLKNLINKEIQARQKQELLDKNKAILSVFKDFKTIIKDIKNLDISNVINKFKEISKNRSSKDFLTGRDSKVTDVLTTKAPKKVFSAVRELTPIINKDSLSGIVKYYNGQKLNTNEKVSLFLDLFSVVPLARGGIIAAKTSANLSIKGFKLNNTISKIINLNKKFKNKNILTIKTFIDFVPSILRDVGFANRAFKATQEFYNVDKPLLDRTAKKLNLGSESALYKKYFGTIANSFSDGKLKLEDLSNWFGIDNASIKSIVKGQKAFRTYLISNGFSKDEANKIIGNLENKRRSRLIAQILGLIKIEITSEKMAQNFIKAGVQKDMAVGISGAREGLASLASEFTLQGYEADIKDVLFAVVTGAVGSILLSAQTKKKLTLRDIERAQNKIINSVNTLKPKQRINLASKAFRVYTKNNLNLKVTPKVAKDAVKALTVKEQNNLNRRYVKFYFENVRGKNLRIISRLAWDRFVSRPINKVSEFINGLFGNLIDPFEVFGDAIVEFQEKLFSKMAKRANLKKKSKLVKKKTPKKKTKVKSVSKTKGKKSTVSKSTAQVKSLGKAVSKAISKTKTKLKSKVKPATKTKSKTKSKSKVKPVTKTKTKTKSKTKTKTKSKTKTKTKSKTKSIQLNLGDIKETKIKRQGYQIVIFRNNKVVARSSKSLPEKRANNLARRRILKSKLGDSYRLNKKGKTNLKDVDNILFVDKFKRKGNKISLISNPVKKKTSQIKNKKSKTIKRVKKSSKKRSKSVKRKSGKKKASKGKTKKK